MRFLRDADAHRAADLSRGLVRGAEPQGAATAQVEAVQAAVDAERGGEATRSPCEVEQAIDGGYSMIVLSDRAISASRVPVSTLLACGAVHHHLVSRAKRTRIGIVLET